MNHHNLLAICLLCASTSSAQTGDVQPVYIPPMDIPMILSGNFMELRSNHFHSGLDFKTQGREGIPVKAVADGWVSRIKISPWGYGKAVYIDHPTGHTSVYGHLSALQGTVAEACLDAQYRAKDFSIDVNYDRGTLPVRQGDVIGLSGNTGGSGGPHLHFELRRSSDQRALDPEALGYDLPDSSPPEIAGLRIYPLTDSSRVAPYPGDAKGLATQGGSGRYALKPGTTPMAYGTVGIAVNTFDRYDNSHNKCGVRRIHVLVDSVPVWTAALDHVDFDLQRYCNAHMDHELFKRNSLHYHRCYRLPHNKLRLYGKEPAQGRITLKPGHTHRVEVLVSDASGNLSRLSFDLEGATAETAARWPEEHPKGSLFRHDTRNVLEEEGVRLEMPAFTLYDDAVLQYARRKGPPGAIAPVHVLHDHTVPLHTNCELRIDVPGLPERLRSKALIVTVDDQGKVKPVGGSHQGGRMVAQVKSLGGYSVMVDTVAPRISPIDLRSDMRGRSFFRMRITDDLAGVASWKGTLDGQWILLEYEPKDNTLTHHFDKHSAGSGKRRFELEVKDERGNVGKYALEVER